MPLQHVAPNPESPAFDLGDRLHKARTHCGIKSATDMARLLNERLGPRLKKPIAPSTINAWEHGTSQPSRRTVEVSELVPVWVEICNEAGADQGRHVTEAWLYGLEPRSRCVPWLSSVEAPEGQMELPLGVPERTLVALG
jgi:hypothetical protein